MAGKDGEIALGAGNHDLAHICRKQQTLGRDEFEMHLTGHSPNLPQRLKRAAQRRMLRR